MWLVPSLRKTQQWKAAVCDRSRLFSPKPRLEWISFAHYPWPCPMQRRHYLTCKRVSILPQSTYGHLSRTGSFHSCFPLCLTSGPLHLPFIHSARHISRHAPPEDVVVYHGSLQASSVPASGSQRALDLSPVPTCDSSTNP